MGIALALALRLLPTVRLQLAGLALLAVGLPLAAVILGGLVMFHMHDDVKILAVAAGVGLDGARRGAAPRSGDRTAYPWPGGGG